MDGLLLRAILNRTEIYGLEKNTAVILTGDHGTNVGERGRFGKGQPVREQEAHVPLFIRLPEGDAGRSNVIVQPQDFFPTILNILGETVPEGNLEGYDILTPARERKSGSGSSPYPAAASRDGATPRTTRI